MASGSVRQAGAARLFVAVPASRAVKEAASRLIQGARRTGADVKWVEDHNLHITLKFLGDVERDMIPEVVRRVTEVCSQCKPFDVTFSGVGAFPGSGPPRVLWLAASDLGRSLSSLAARMDQELSTMGFAREPGKFQAHLTLGRARSSRGVDEALACLRALGEGLSVPMKVSEVHVIESVLSRLGPAYRVLASVPIGP